MDRSSAATRRALVLLAECLNDPDPREATELAERMEDVFKVLGGKIEEGEARVGD